MSLPEKFGRYEVLDVLGQGAMGLVYKAVDPVIERGVAVKVIQANPGLSGAELERMQARFEQEFRSAGALSHSNIVTIFDVGKEGDHYYIAMEYVEGRSLDVVIGERGVLTGQEVSDLAAELSSGLDYAHAQGVVHRDIKPANVLITHEGRSKITDFGLAKLEATTLTRTGALVGTPAYMSPEQVGGHTITGKTDQFSLAILLYQALTGERPFTGDSASTIMYKIVHEEPLPPTSVNKSLPRAIDAVLLRGLAKGADDRFGSCSELAEGLRQSLGAAPTAAINTAAPAPGSEATVVEPAAAPSSPPSGDPPPSGSPAPAAAASLPGDSGAAAGAVPLDAIPPDSAAPDAPPPSVPPPSSGGYGGTGAPPGFPSDGSHSYVQPAPMPRWMLTLAIVLPSIALLAVVGWFVAQGGFGQAPAGQDPGEGSSLAGTELGEGAAPGGATPVGGDDAEPVTSGGEETPSPATAEDIDAVRNEFSAEVQQLREQVEAANQTDPEAATEPPVDPPARPQTIDIPVVSEPSGALVFLNGLQQIAPTPTTLRLDTNSDHRIELRMRGYQIYARDVQLAGVPADEFPPGLDVTLAANVAGAAAPNDAARGNRGGNRGNRDRILGGLDGLDDIPENLRHFIDVNDVPTGTVVLDSPRFVVAVRVNLAPNPANMSPQIRQQIRALSDEARQQIMRGFTLVPKDRHEIELPVGSWVITLLQPRVMYMHQETVGVRRDQQLDLSHLVPTEFFNISITSEPTNVRFRVDGLPIPYTTPHNGPVVPGMHRFVFDFGGQTVTRDALVDRDGMTIVGQRQR